MVIMALNCILCAEVWLKTARIVTSFAAVSIACASNRPTWCRLKKMAAASTSHNAQSDVTIRSSNVSAAFREIINLGPIHGRLSRNQTRRSCRTEVDISRRRNSML